MPAVQRVSLYRSSVVPLLMSKAMQNSPLCRKCTHSLRYYELVLDFFCSTLLEVYIENLRRWNDFLTLNELLWQDGFLIDFLQKKVADKWLRKFVIYSGYLFSERLMFDYVVRFYLDLVMWPTYNKSIYEFNTVSATLSMTLLLLMAFFLLITSFYFWTVLM